MNTLARRALLAAGLAAAISPAFAQAPAWSTRPVRMAPEIPTVAEAGLPQLEQEVLYVAWVPAATPESVVQAIQKAIGDALARADVRSRLDGLDLQYEGLTGAAAGKRLNDLSERYAKVIRATGMKVE